MDISNQKEILVHPEFLMNMYDECICKDMSLEYK